MNSIHHFLIPGENGTLTVVNGKLLEMEPNSYSFVVDGHIGSDKIMIQFTEPKGEINRVIFKMLLDRDQAKALKKAIKQALKELDND